MNNEDYHNNTSRISKSGLDLIRKSPLLYWYKKLSGEHEDKSTKALEFGSLYHDFILEQSVFNNRYVCLPENAPKAPTKSQINAANPSEKTIQTIAWWEAFINNNKNKKIISAEDLKTVVDMRNALKKHELAWSYISSEGQYEMYNEWIDPKTGVKCKSKMDKVILDSDLIIDLKSTIDASYKSFQKTMLNYRYHVQGSFYSDGYYETYGRYPNFLFIAQEKSPPYMVGVYLLTDEWRQIGKNEYLNDLLKYKECIDTNTWPGYNNNEMVELDVLSWMK